MSGRLQVGSVRSFGCYFSWLCLPNVTCTHKNTQRLLRTVCVSMVVPNDNYCVCFQFLHYYTALLASCITVFPFPLSRFFVFFFFSFLTHCPQACFLASSIVLHVIFITISSSLDKIFLESSFPCSEGEKERHEGKRIQYTAPHEEQGASMPHLS